MNSVPKADLSPHKKPRKRTFLSGILILLFCCFLLAFAAANAPDVDLHFLREVDSKLSPQRISLMVNSVERWPQWFYSLGSAELVGPDGKTPETSTLIPGNHVLLKMNPGKPKKKQFELEWEILSFIPGQTLELGLKRDSSGRLHRIFDSLVWKIEIQPTSQGGSLIRGRAVGHTNHWRSRLLGRMAERIVMNQVFYPNLIVLSELKQPFSADPSSAPGAPDRSSLW